MLRNLKLILTLPYNEYGNFSNWEIFEKFELMYEYDVKKQYVIISDENWNINIFEIIC